jgi:hypothetical protein
VRIRGSKPGCTAAVLRYELNMCGEMTHNNITPFKVSIDLDNIIWTVTQIYAFGYIKQ